VISFVDTNDIYVSTPFNNAYTGQPVQQVGESHEAGATSSAKFVSCSVTDTAPIVTGGAAVATATVAMLDLRTVTLSSTPSSNLDISLGTRIRLEKSAGVFETRVVDSKDGDTLTVSSDFSAAMADVKIWVVGTGTTEDNTCSGRGLCSSESGVCECFAGYTLDDCSAQNALAA